MNVTFCSNVDGFTDELIAVVVLALFTTWLAADDVLVSKLLFPEYWAVTEWVATLNADVDNVALSPLMLDVPNDVTPSKNSIVPLGLPAPGDDTLTRAVNVTFCSNVDGFTDELIAVVVLALFTTWLTADDVLVVKLLFPEYWAVTEWVATLNAEVDNVALSPLMLDVPNDVAPSKNSIVPLGLPAPGDDTLTRAVNVTD